MESQKEIFILKNVLERHCPNLVEDGCGYISCSRCLATFLIKAGFRKQSEWISVSECLPKEDERVLVYLESDRSYTKVDTDRLSEGKWVRWASDVRYWMPLPELPNLQ